jgi:DNA 3'-phosphatase
MTKIIFADLDSTLIETKSGKTFPINILDFKPIWKVWKYLKANLEDGDYFFIVSNQGGISRGLVGSTYFSSKINYICSALKEYLRLKDVVVDNMFCISEDPTDNMRKPNTGMFEEMIKKYGLESVPKDCMIMIGDASGRPGDFSDSDLKAATNFGIKYLDVDDIQDV